MSKVRKNRNGLSRPKRAYEDIPFEVPNVLTSSAYGGAVPAASPSRLSAQVLRDGPDAYWQFEDSLVFADSSGRGYTANAPATDINYTTGVVSPLLGGRRALSVNGNQTRTSLTTTLVVGTTCTFEFWFVPAAGTNHYSLIAGATGGGSSLYYAHDLNKILLFGGADQTNTTALVNGTLYHVVVSVSAGSGTFYINGVADGTLTGWPGCLLSSLFCISGGPPSVAGTFDEMAIYSKALTAQQAKDHYTLGVGSY